MGRRFTGCGAAVVAANTGSGHCAVIDIGIAPAAGDVAVITAVGCGNVSGRFARCGTAVVAANTAAGQGGCR